MSNGFTAIDLSQLPPPEVVEQLDYETLLQKWIADFQRRDPDYVDLTEADPIMKLLQVGAYQEFIYRQRVNEASLANLLAYGLDGDLDQLAARYPDARRMVLDPGDPVRGIDPIFESNEDFRNRIPLSLEGFSTAGPEGAYIFHALSADPDVLDASATQPSTGTVLVTVLSRGESGIPSEAVLGAVRARLSDARRPLTDEVITQAAEIITYAIDATIFTFSGPDTGAIEKNARNKLDEYVKSAVRLGLDITISRIIAALSQEGVQDVIVHSPPENVVCTRTQAAVCTGFNLTNGGIRE